MNRENQSSDESAEEAGPTGSGSAGDEGWDLDAVLGDETSPEARLEMALAEQEQLRAMAQRAQADLVNYRRRATEEREEARRSAVSSLILKVLAVIDDLDRALELVPDDAVSPGWLEGVQLVQRKLQGTLDSEGVTRISALGQPFLPSEHEAVYYEESPDGSGEEIVLRVIREGYKIHDRVLRAAQVSVSRPR